MLFIIVMCFIGFAHAMNWTDPISTPKGLVRGLLAEDGDYSMYLGIPYARVNDKNPFGESIAYPRFLDVFNAISDAAVCPQQNVELFGPSIDCLHINVYVPNTRRSQLAVLVYIYGGGFMSGFAGRFVYGPKYLVRHDIIVVTFNYRVSAYGFMCTDTEDVPGNQGLKDQYLALEWIHENIASFGGDVNKITLMGGSAGAMSIDHHLMSDYPMLYNQAILQSGTALVPMYFQRSDDTGPFKIAEYLGHVTDDLTEALSFLASVDTNSVTDAIAALNMTFAPCVEKEFSNVKRLIAVHPEHNNATRVRGMNILAGFTSNEEMLAFVGKTFDKLKIESLFRDYLTYHFNIQELDDMVQIVRRFYIGDDKINEELNWKLTDFLSDFMFNHPVQRGLVKYIEQGAQVFQYMFSYSGKRNYLKQMLNLTAEGAAHAEEVPYLFDVSFINETPTVEDQITIDRMTSLYANFVKYGNPTPLTSELIPVVWSAASNNMISYLDINSELTLGTRPYHARVSFWDLFYDTNKDKLWANIYCDYCSSSSTLNSSSIFLELLFFLVIYFITRYSIFYSSRILILYD